MMWSASWRCCSKDRNILDTIMFSVHTINLRMSNAFLIENDQGLTLVDAGAPREQREIMNAVQAVGKPLQLIFITHAHFDHYGSANAVRKQTGAPVAIHAADAAAMAAGKTPIRTTRGRGWLSMPFLPLLKIWRKQLYTRADILLQDGDRLDPYGIHARLLHTPGHTAGSSTLVVENEQHEAVAAFVGDLVTAGRVPALQCLYAEDWDDMNNSLERLQTCCPERVYAAHGTHIIDAQELQEIKLNGD